MLLLSFSQRRCLFRAGLRGCKVKSFARLAWRPPLYTDIHKNKRCQTPLCMGFCSSSGSYTPPANGLAIFSRETKHHGCALWLCARGCAQLCCAVALGNLSWLCALRCTTSGLRSQSGFCVARMDFWILQTVGHQHTLGPILVVHVDLLQSGVG